VYCGDNDAQLDRNNMFYHEASGGKYVTRAVFFDLEPGVIDVLRASPLGYCSSSVRKTSCTIRAGKTESKTTSKGLSTYSSDPPSPPPEVQQPTPRLSSRFDSSATHARTLLPAEFSSMPVGFVLVRVFSVLCSKLRAPHRGASIGPFVCGARACSLCSLCLLRLRHQTSAWASGALPGTEV
jgi:hypothetical protein